MTFPTRDTTHSRPLDPAEHTLITAHIAARGVTRCPLGARSEDPNEIVPMREQIRSDAKGRRPWQAAYDEAARRREKALPMFKSGRPHREIAVDLQVSVGTVHCYARHLREEGRL